MAANKKLKIDKEFESLIRPLDNDEFGWLEDSIKKEGCIDPIVVWEDTVIDGHHRYKICTKNDIDFDLKYIDFQNREEALDWIDIRQIGRRNLTRDDFQNIVGRVYNRRKKASSGRSDRDLSGRQNDAPKTSQKVSEQFGVSPRTVERASKFNEKVEEVKQKEPELTQDVAYKKAKEELKSKKVICGVCGTEHSEKKECPKCKKAKEELDKASDGGVKDISTGDADVEDRGSKKSVEGLDQGETLLNNGEVNNEMETQKEWVEPDSEFLEMLGRKKDEMAMKYVRLAIYQLERIDPSHHDKEDALAFIIDWVEKFKQRLKEKE